MVRYHHITQSQPLPVGALRARHGGPFRPMSAHFVRGFEVLGAESAPFECRARRLPCNRCSGFPRNLRSAGGRRDVWSTGGDAARASTCCHRVGRARCGGVGATVEQNKMGCPFDLRATEIYLLMDTYRCAHGSVEFQNKQVQGLDEKRSRQAPALKPHKEIVLGRCKFVRHADS